MPSQFHDYFYSMENPTKRQYFENINGLRFLGAMGVLIWHCATFPGDIWGSFSEELWFDRIYFLFSRGPHIGIMLFFVISGFLITSIFLWEHEESGKINIGRFFIRRLFRVWPLYFLIIIFGFFLFPHMPYGKETVHEFWRFFFFSIKHR